MSLFNMIFLKNHGIRMGTKQLERKPISMMAVASMVCSIVAFLDLNNRFINFTLIVLAIFLGLKAKDDIRYFKQKKGLIFAQVGIYSVVIQFAILFIIYFPSIVCYLTGNYYH